MQPACPNSPAQVARYKQMLVRYNELAFRSQDLYRKSQATNAELLSRQLRDVCEACGGRCARAQRECVVCLQPPEQWVMMRPCGHVCACHECAQALDSCPLCRCAIEGRLAAFI